MPAKQHYIVVGAGAFGASTALGLARLGHRVTVLERAPDGYAAPDSASNDVNKIIRSDYSNPHYELLARWAIAAWRSDPVLSRYYHDTGFVLASRFNREEGIEYVRSCMDRSDEERAGSSSSSSSSSSSPYSAASLASSSPKTPFEIVDAETTARAFPAASHDHLGSALKNLGKTALGYCNPEGGWAESGAATNAVLDQAKELGAQVVGGVEASALILDSIPGRKPRVQGVVASDGRQFHADKVVLAPGAWLTGLLKQLLPKDAMWSSLPAGPCRPSGQTVLSFKLDEEARKRYHGTPVVLDFSTGFYVFPPNKDGIVKCAVHGPGFHYPSPGKLASDPSQLPTYAGPSNPAPAGAAIAPNTLITLGDSYRQQHQIEERAPEHTETLLRTLLYDFYPGIATLPDAKRKVCWYSDSSAEDENWIFDWHPRVDGLFLAGAGSGHGFKFLPIFSELITERMGLAPRTKWSNNPWGEHQDLVWTLTYREELADSKKPKPVRARL
ncbi:unnamed protein product [Parajaminaea phylloscopi]